MFNLLNNNFLGSQHQIPIISSVGNKASQLPNRNKGTTIDNVALHILYEVGEIKRNLETTRNICTYSNLLLEMQQQFKRSL
jgi:hypothetical protein